MKYSHFKLSRAAKTALFLTLMSAFSSTALAEKINLNTADAETMQYIPGIGESRAEQIIEARNRAGGFSSLDQIDAVPGIGETLMQDIRKYGSLDSGVSELTEEMRSNRPLSRSSRQKDAAESGSS